MSFFEDIGPYASIASAIPGIGGVASGVLGGIGALGGLLGASAERKRQEQARQLALQQLSQQLDQEYHDTVMGHAENLAKQGGYGADAIMRLGRTLGSANAAAGVTNSSAVAGSNALAQQNEQTSLANLAGQNRQGELGMLGANKRYIAGLQYNLAGENFNNSALREQQAGGGLMSYLGKLGQYNLGQTGMPTARSGGDAGNGMQNGSLGSVLDTGFQPGVATQGGFPTGFSQGPIIRPLNRNFGAGLGLIGQV